MAERWVFQGSDPHRFQPHVMVIAFGEDYLSSHLERHEHFGTFYTGNIHGRLIGYVRVPPGTVIIEGVMRSLAFTGVDTVIGLGTCGALQPEIDCGDLIVADAARAGDALSPHYGFEAGQMVPADAGLAASMGDFLVRRGLSCRRGPIVTTGAAFRETDELIAGWSGDGLLGVELEASALFALGGFMGIRTTMALMVTDSPVRGQLSDALGSDSKQRFIGGFKEFLGSPELP